MNSVLNGLFGGWRLTGLVRWRTGFPFNPGNGNAYPTNYALKGPATLKADAIVDVSVAKNASGGPNIFPDPAKAYASFQRTRSGFSGSRNTLYGPELFTLDSGVQKIFKIGENREIQFRWETFNLTNTVSFDGRANSPRNRGIDVDLDARASFGRLRSLAANPRIMQFALRYQF